MPQLPDQPIRSAGPCNVMLLPKNRILATGRFPNRSSASRLPCRGFVHVRRGRPAPDAAAKGRHVDALRIGGIECHALDIREGQLRQTAPTSGRHRATARGRRRALLRSASCRSSRRDRDGSSRRTSADPGDRCAATSSRRRACGRGHLAGRPASTRTRRAECRRLSAWMHGEILGVEQRLVRVDLLPGFAPVARSIEADSFGLQRLARRPAALRRYWRTRCRPRCRITR